MNEQLKTPVLKSTQRKIDTFFEDVNEYGEPVESAVKDLKRFLKTAQNQLADPNSQLDLKNKKDMAEDIAFLEEFIKEQLSREEFN